VRVPEPNTKGGYRYEQREPHAVFDLEYIVNYVTPGYATAVYASASGVERIRTTAESHRRIAIIEVVWTPVLTRRSSRVWHKAMPLIRNAGGRASEDAIRSLVISYKLLGTREWFIIHHTDCGMELFTNETMPELLEKSLETARLEEVKEATQVGAASAS
jgi:carbonic anhydrase